jgi:hypothetical protein
MKEEKRSLYSVHPGVEMVKKWVVALPEKTGRSLDEWIAFIETAGPATEMERREWLKKEFNLGTNTAWWLAERAAGKGEEDSDDEKYLMAAEKYVEAMYSGAKSQLKPLYDRLLQIGLKLGKDVKACPGKTIVPLYRNHVFAQIKPTTRTRIDLGLALKDRKAEGLLISTGGHAKGDRISHRIAIASLTDINDEVKHWLKFAYEMDKQ